MTLWYTLTTLWICLVLTYMVPHRPRGKLIESVCEMLDDCSYVKPVLAFTVLEETPNVPVIDQLIVFEYVRDVPQAALRQLIVSLAISRNVHPEP